MASDLEQKAKEAFIDDQLELAMELYNQAIDLNPNYAELYAGRAQANIKLNNLTEAVADANKAIELEPSMSKAYLPSSVACMGLEEYPTAKAALEIGTSLAPGESRFTNLMKECDQHIAEENTDLLKNSIEHNNTTNYSTIDFQPVNDVSIQATKLSVKPKYRHQFHENAEVVVTILGKKIPAKNVFVEYGEQILSVTIDMPGEDPYHFQPRLFAKILPAKCKYDVLSTKIEIRLAKAEPIRWTSLEFSKEISVPQTVSTSAVGSQRPDYPSSKPKKVNWDKLEAQMKKEEKEEKLDGDAALNKFFRDIFKDADKDTRRAMQKSFVESNGTVLSTNWNEVGSKKVGGSPPDGMEVKKWEY